MATKEGGTAKTSEKDVDGLRIDVQSLSGDRAKLSETRRELERKLENLEVLKRKVEDQERDTAEQLRSVRRQEEEAVQRELISMETRLKDVCSAFEIENAQRLDKLPQEVWEKILDELDENDLFPLALSCRYFRQKQKELVARTRQSGPGSGKPRRALKTTLHEWPVKDQPASAEYLRFCSKEKASNEIPNRDIDVEQEEKALRIRVLAALHGYLPLLQEDLKGLGDGPWNMITREVAECAGESSLQSSLLLL